jgi:hypothetical protein
MKSETYIRLKAALIHLTASVVVALSCAILILYFWFPGQYREMAGGNHLLFLIISVDVVLGPLLTFVAFNISKPRTELIRDLFIIGMLQVSGLVYGIHTVYLARPVALVFEQTRFRVVSYIQVDQSELPEMTSEIPYLSLSGPVLLSVRDFKDDREKSEAVEKGLAGADVGVQPKFWQPYAKANMQLRKVARPYAVLIKKYPSDSKVSELPGLLGLNSNQLVFIPVVTRTGDWVVVLSAQTLLPLAFIPKDGFFDLAAKS